MQKESTRQYRSPVRQSQAAETRERVLRAAADCFVSRGYQGTTLTAIASAAGVSVETVKNTAPKHQLLLAAFEVALVGREGKVGPVDDDQFVAMFSAPNVVELICGMVAVANSRSASLWTAFLSAASSDATVHAELRALLERRRADYGKLVAGLGGAGAITSAAPRADLADALSFLCSPEGYQQLVTQAGWTEAAYVAWLAESVRRVILN